MVLQISSYQQMNFVLDFTEINSVKFHMFQKKYVHRTKPKTYFQWR
jgi:hypothetical protein